MEEVWKDITGYEGLYQVSNFGNIKRDGKNLSPGLGGNGYYLVVLSKNGKTKSATVHRLVASAFIPNPNNYPYVNHKDETRTNNHVDNLEWCTPRYNAIYGNAKAKEAASKSRPVEQLLSGVVIKRWSSTREAHRAGYKSGCISACCNNRRLTHKGYEWRWAA